MTNDDFFIVSQQELSIEYACSSSGKVRVAPSERVFREAREISVLERRSDLQTLRSLTLTFEGRFELAAEQLVSIVFATPEYLIII